MGQTLRFVNEYRARNHCLLQLSNIVGKSELIGITDTQVHGGCETVQVTKKIKKLVRSHLTTVDSTGKARGAVTLEK